MVVSPIMKQAATIVQNFIRTHSYSTYDMCQHIGFWRSLLVRFSDRTNQLCLVVIVGNPYERSTPKAEDAVEKLTAAVREEIDRLMHELLGVVRTDLPCLASFSYQM